MIKPETELMIKNQMVTNGLLALLVATANKGQHGDLSLMIANKLDELTDDMVKAANELSHLK